MKVKLKDILLGIESLKDLSEQKNISAFHAFDIAKSIVDIEKEINIYRESVKKAIEKFGIDSSKPLNVEDNQELIKEIQELESKEIDLPISKIKISVLKDCEMCPKKILGILWMIEDDRN